MSRARFAMMSAMMQAGESGAAPEPTTDLTGWILDSALTSMNYINTSSTTSISPYYSMTEGESIKFKVANSYSSYYYCFTNKGSGTGGRIASDAAHTVVTATVPSGATYMRFSAKTADLDDCYIYNLTTLTYLWAGKNVDTSTAPT